MNVLRAVLLAALALTGGIIAINAPWGFPLIVLALAAIPLTTRDDLRLLAALPLLVSIISDAPRWGTLAVLIAFALFILDENDRAVRFLPVLPAGAAALVLALAKPPVPVTLAVLGLAALLVLALIMIAEYRGAVRYRGAA